MANRNFPNKYVFGMELAVKQIFAKVTFGASGAPTLSSANSKGVSSISRSSAGRYVITMGCPASSQAAMVDKYKKFLSAKHTFFTTGNPAAPLMKLHAEALSTAGTITIQFLAVDGTTATDPASGEVVYLEVKLGDSNV
jgi:hypothetical protein